MGVDEVRERLAGAFGAVSERVPSFPVVALLIAVIIAGGLFFILISQPQLVEVKIIVENAAGANVRGAQVSVLGLEKEISLATDKDGKALLQLPKGKDVEIGVSKANYEGEKMRFRADSPQDLKFVLKQQQAPLAKDLTFTFVGPDGKKLEGKEISVILSCAGSEGKFEQPQRSVSTGELRVVAPEKCGRINITASAPGFSSASMSAIGTEQIISFQAIEKPKGNLEVKVRDFDSRSYLDSKSVRLLDSTGQDNGFSATTSFGEVLFTGIGIGTYTLVVDDPLREYGTGSSTVSVSPNSTEKKEVLLSKDVKLRPKIKVVDSNGALALADVSIGFPDGRVAGRAQSGEDGFAVFALSDNGIYFYSAYKEGYLPSDRNSFSTSAYGRGSTQEFILRLEKCTPQKCGLVKVSVIDENGFAVENAKVSILNSDGFIEAAYGTRTTDYNGNISPFNGVAKGNFRILAQKFPAEARSDIVSIDPSKTNEFTIKMAIGTGTVKINAFDSDANPVPFAQADIFTDYGQRIGTVSLDGKGEGSLSLKADKKVYAIIMKDGFARYVTAPRQVFPGRAVQLTGRLGADAEVEKPSIEFIGMYSPSGQKVEGLSAGGAYTARFLLRIPSSAVLQKAGVLIRTGDKSDVDKDSMWITSVAAPLSAVQKGWTYDPAGTDEPNGDMRADAKWADIVWNDPQAGMYEIEAGMKVRNGTTKGTELPVFYRAWGVSNGRYLRDPVDSEIGEGEDGASKKALYAQSYERIFIEGQAESCDSAFCFSGRLLGIDDGVYTGEPYMLKTFAPYRLEFGITNNSDILHDNAAITIRSTTNGTSASKDLSIDAYSLRNADSQQFSSAAPARQIEPLAMGMLRRNKSFSGTLDLSAKSASGSGIQFIIVSNRQEVYNNILKFSAFYEDDVNISMQPQKLIAFVPLDINISASYASGEKSGFPIEGANVIVKKIAPDLSESVFAAKTNSRGFAAIRVPASSPGSKVIVKVEKPGIGSEIIEKLVSADVISIEPESIKAGLNRDTLEEIRIPLTIRSNLAGKVALRKMRVSANSRGFIDLEKMNTYLVQYNGLQIPSGEERTIDFLSAAGSEARFLERPATIKGTLIIETALANDSNTAWISRMPFEITVNLAQMPSNAPCIVISKSEWKDATLGGNASAEFEIENNCAGDSGKPIDLANLQSQVVWQGKEGIIGQVELSITDPESGEVSSEVLQQGLWSRLREKFVSGTLYPARLTFIPKANTLGRKAEFEVKIDAQLETNEGSQYVGANNSIKSEIMVANLDQCIEIMPHPEQGILIRRDETESSFTVETKKCGPIELDIRFCSAGSDFCRGGSDEGGITLRPWTYTKIKEDAREVKVERQEIAGLYGIKVDARPQGGSWKQVAEIKALIEPEAGDYFTLDKYAFTLIGKDSRDSAELTNFMLQENIAVRANLCDWGDAEPGLSDAEKAAIGLAGAGAGVGAGFAAMAILPTLSPLAASGIGAVVLLIVIIIVMMMDDPCEEFKTETLQDYAINLAGTSDPSSPYYLPPDALNILLSDSRIKGSWNVDITDAVQKKNAKYPNGKQIAGIVFENPGGAEQDEPAYAIATLRANEHIHGDSTHQNAAVDCKGADFGLFWIGAPTCSSQGRVYDDIYQQKLHLRFNLAEQTASIPKVSFDTYACQSGVEIGRTGEGALPRIKLNWSWNEDTDGITYNQCDAGNPDYIYCDATQFTIELNKKLSMLNEFLQANDYNLGCPATVDMKAEAMAEMHKRAARTVDQGKVGLSKAIANEADKIVTIVATVDNSSDTSQSAVVKVTVGGTGSTKQECVMSIESIPAHGQKSGSCPVTVIDDGDYGVLAGMESTSSPALLDKGQIITGVIVGSRRPSGEDACRLKTTETFEGVPHILKFIDNKPDVKWTARVPDRQALTRLLIFDAYLMKDNYSKEFFSDFSSYYTKSAFEDTDSYFHSMGQDSAGRKYGLNLFMDSNKFVLTNKYIASSELSGPGLYRVEFALYFNEKDWKLFDANGDLRGYVAMVVHRMDDPYPASPFYSMPLDGMVGLEGDRYRRENYGTAYSSENNDFIYINGGNQPVKSYADNGSAPVSKVNVKVKHDLYSLNTSPASRGMIMQVSGTGTRSSNIIFQPSHATPVMMKVAKDKLSDEKFSTYFGVISGTAPQDTGQTLAFWDGAGNCIDYSNVPVAEAFYQKPDRKAAESDRLSEWKGAYALDWAKALSKGDVYLRTILYTNPGDDVKLKAFRGGTPATFYTGDETGEVVGLNGISNMPHNNYSGGSLGTISTMADILQMVGDGMVCVTNTGNSTKFWWNPQAIYDEKGTQRNISAQTKNLEAGKSCIG